MHGSTAPIWLVVQTGIKTIPASIGCSCSITPPKN